MEVAHVDRIGYDKLIKDSLQHILLTTQNQKRKNIYRYLYPKMEKCEKLIEEKFNVTEGILVIDIQLIFASAGFWKLIHLSS